MNLKTNFYIRQIVQKFLPSLVINAHQRSTLHLLGICKTSALGGHREKCNQCSFERFHYNSCGNRNCPSCQGVKKQEWIYNRMQDLLPVKYYHCVFTIPSELYIYFRYNKILLYNTLLQSVRETLMTFGKDPRYGIAGKIGGIQVLHTWTQQLQYHPHVHCIVPAGGLSHNGKWNHSCGNGLFLFPVRAMSVFFRGRFMAKLKAFFKLGKLSLPDQAIKNHHKTKELLYKKKWVVYAKRPFGGPEQVLEYLGRYTHKICISNYRIISVSDTHVTFRFQNRRKKKLSIKTIEGTQFLRLFAEHILPKGFVKIRHFGLLSARTKKKDLQLARKSLGVPSVIQRQKLSTQELIRLANGKNPYQCPNCQKGEMIIVQVIPSIRGSPVKTPIRIKPKYRKIKLDKSLA